MLNIVSYFLENSFIDTYPESFSRSKLEKNYYDKIGDNFSYIEDPFTMVFATLETIFS